MSSLKTTAETVLKIHRLAGVSLGRLETLRTDIDTLTYVFKEIQSCVSGSENKDQRSAPDANSTSRNE
jgi:hypothetical protein